MKLDLWPFLGSHFRLSKMCWETSANHTARGGSYWQKKTCIHVLVKACKESDLMVANPAAAKLVIQRCQHLPTLQHKLKKGRRLEKQEFPTLNGIKLYKTEYLHTKRIFTNSKFSMNICTCVLFKFNKSK